MANGEAVVVAVEVAVVRRRPPQDEWKVVLGEALCQVFVASAMEAIYGPNIIFDWN